MGSWVSIPGHPSVPYRMATALHGICGSQFLKLGLGRMRGGIEVPLALGPAIPLELAVSASLRWIYLELGMERSPVVVVGCVFVVCGCLCLLKM